MECFWDIRYQLLYRVLTQNLLSCQKSSFETWIYCSANLKIAQKYKLQLCFRVYKTITDTNWVIMLITHIICWFKFIRLRFPLNNFIIHKIDLALFTQRYNELVIYLPELDLQTLACLKWSFLQQHVTDEDQKLLLQRAST